jgi:TPR repeat protein
MSALHPITDINREIADIETAQAEFRFRALNGQGHAQAQYNLGNMYRRGQGVPQHDAEAVKWLSMAAEQGFAKAQIILGFMYFYGQGVPQDDAEAVRWNRKAAELGFASPQYNLGFMYGNGRGVPQDYVSALMWWNIAAASGHEGAQRDREVMTERMTPDQIAEAQRMAREWMAKYQR